MPQTAITHVMYKKLRKMMRTVATIPLFEIGKNAKYTFSQLMELPIASALNGRSIENQSLQIDRASADAFYYHFGNKLKIENLEDFFTNHVKRIMKILRRQGIFDAKIIIGIDKTEEHYWGEHEENPFVTGGKRVTSTNYAFRYLTTVIVIRGQRFIIGLKPLTKEDNDDAKLVHQALEGVNKIGFKVSKLLMDKEFYNGDIVLICNGLNIQFVVPVVKNDKFQRLVADLRKDKTSFPCVIADYDVAGSETCLALYEDENDDGRVEVFGFITNMDKDDVSKDIDSIIELYKMRWGVENAHKYEDKFRIPTNSDDGLVRFFFFIMGAMFHNFWVLLSLLASSFGASKLSISVFIDIMKCFFVIREAEHYKHPQRELWIGVLLGKNTTKRDRVFGKNMLICSAITESYFPTQILLKY